MTRRIVSSAANLVLIALVAPIALCQQRDEREVRAAYLYNLIKYVEWPADRAELDVAYLGDTATGETLQKMLNGRTADTHVIHVVLSPKQDELERSSIVYFAGLKSPETLKGLDRLKGRNILTLGETEEFARDGGIVGLVKVDDHIQIEVNLQAAQRAGVKISSRVLSLAVIVRPAQNAKN